MLPRVLSHVLPQNSAGAEQKIRGEEITLGDKIELDILK